LAEEWRREDPLQDLSLLVPLQSHTEKLGCRIDEGDALFLSRLCFLLGGVRLIFQVR
jgi:hypothetical protein